MQGIVRGGGGRVSWKNKKEKGGRQIGGPGKVALKESIVTQRKFIQFIKTHTNVGRK